LIILNINEKNELIANINGTRDNFLKEVNYIKNIHGAKFDKENKAWILPRSLNIIKQLKNKFVIGSNFDIYELANIKAPYIETSVDIFLNEINGDIKKFMEKFKVNNLNLELKDFQKLGVSTALYYLLEDNGFLIADEMGLGKTIQALAVINSLKKLGFVNKVLITCPKNVKLQWGHEIEDFSNLDYVIIDGYNKEKRLECYKENKSLYIINHDLLISDNDYEEIIHNINPDLIVVDEIHYFKTHTTKRTRALKTLKAKFKLGLTGTPLQNKPGDIHSIFEFLIPGYLGNWTKFRKEYILFDHQRGYPISYRNLFDLKIKISKRIIRRLADDVSDELPIPHYKTHKINMDLTQRIAHAKIEEMIDNVKIDIEEISDSNDKNKETKLDDLSGKVMGLMNVQIAISDDLRILSMSEKKWIRDLFIVDNNYESNKIKKLKEIIFSILTYDINFKIIIFSQFARMVNLIKQDLLKIDSINEVAIIYGALNENQRDDEIQKFKNNNNCRIIVLSDAGAIGYNLQRASHLINYDQPWNPAILDQRNGRIRRIGSPWKHIFISNLMSLNSVDEKINDTITRKRIYFDKIIENTDNQVKALKEFVKKVI